MGNGGGLDDPILDVVASMILSHAIFFVSFHLIRYQVTSFVLLTLRLWHFDSVKRDYLYIDRMKKIFSVVPTYRRDCVFS